MTAEYQAVRASKCAALTDLIIQEADNRGADPADFFTVLLGTTKKGLAAYPDDEQKASEYSMALLDETFPPNPALGHGVASPAAG